MDVTTSTSTLVTKDNEKRLQSKPLSKFPKFPKLPTELRLEIWQWVARVPRVIEIRSVAGVTMGSFETMDFDFYADESKGIRTNAKVPTILLVNNEARQEGLKFYQLSLGLVGSEVHTYVNFEVDTIDLTFGDTYLAGLPLLETLRRMLPSGESEKIQHMLISDREFRGYLESFRRANIRPIASIIRRSFSGLSELVILGDNPFPAESDSETCLELAVRASFDEEKSDFP